MAGWGMTYAERHDEAVIGHQGTAVRQAHVGLLADREQQVLAHPLAFVQAERAALPHSLILRFACSLRGACAQLVITHHRTHTHAHAQQPPPAE
jgi:hypothetical protein